MWVCAFLCVFGTTPSLRGALLSLSLSILSTQYLQCEMLVGILEKDEEETERREQRFSRLVFLFARCESGAGRWRGGRGKEKRPRELSRCVVSLLLLSSSSSSDRRKGRWPPLSNTEPLASSREAYYPCCTALYASREIVVLFLYRYIFSVFLFSCIRL